MKPDSPGRFDRHSWPDRVALHIHDPVRRLRFVRAVGPALLRFDARRERWSARRRAVLAVVLAAPAVACAILGARGCARRPETTRSAAHRVEAKAPEPPAAASADVWLVDTAGDLETYSNGLRIDNRLVTETRPRSYLAFPLAGGEPEQGSEPVGIVFHTTESRQAPLEAGRNRELKVLSESLLAYIHRRQSYNFVIDRFGRVYRIVRENHVSYHSGYSVWSDDRRSYLNLNESFLGVAFEAANRDRQAPEISPAQARAAEMLLEWLRRRFSIAAGNCVTHAQVSVNPSNLRVGYHVDWAAGFPFDALRLPDNNPATLPAVSSYGFAADAAFLRRAGPGLRQGVARAEAFLEERAAATGKAPRQYRATLQKRYRELLAKARSVRPDGGRAE